MRKIGIEWGFFPALPREEAIRLMKKNGFETTLVCTFESDFDGLMKDLTDNGIVCESGHAPFYGSNAIWQEGEEGEQMLSSLIRGVENCARWKIPVMVVHLSSGEHPPRINDLGQARWDRLMEAADRLGVRIAFENLRLLGNLAYSFEQYPQAGFCWDVGHEACFAHGRRFMPLFADRMVALHLHDNHAVHNQDEHRIPYDGILDLDLAAREVAKSAYKGSITLELGNVRVNYGEITAEDYYARAAKAARRFAERVEAYEKEL